MISILDSNLKRKAIIKQVITANRFEEINGENKLDFTAVYDEKAATYVNEYNLAELDNDYFDIVYYQKEQNEDGTLTVQVQTEHVSYRLNEEPYNMETFTATGSPETVLEAILVGTPFTVGNIEFSDSITYSIQEKKSRRQMLMEFVILLGGEVDFNQFTVSIVQHRGSTQRKLLAKGKNIKVVSKTFNAREKDALGNSLVSYSCTPIQLLESPFALGDEVLLIQKDLDIQEQMRIVRYGYNPYDNIEASIELANFISGLEDQIYRIQTTSVIKEKLYNGTKIGPEDGFVATRSDLKARAIMNATEGIKIQKGDGNGNWEDAIYLDTQGNGTFSGFILASQIMGGSILIGGEDIETAKFSVDSGGSMIAEDAQVRKTLYLIGNEEQPDEIIQAIQLGVNDFPYLEPAHINYVQGTGIAFTALNINSPGHININATGVVNLGLLIVEGNSVFIGDCEIEPSGGYLRLKNASGAYLYIGDNGLTYYDSLGVSHTVTMS